MEIKVSRLEAKMGAIAQYESKTATYTIYARKGRIWIEAYGRGGRRINTPRVTSEAEARKWCERSTKSACKPEDAISL